MSADFSILGGLILLPVALAVAPIVGGAYAIYKGAQVANRRAEESMRRRQEEKRVQEQLRQKQNESYYNEMQAIYQNYQNITRQHEDAMQQLDDDMHRNMEVVYDEFKAQINRDGYDGRQRLEEQTESMAEQLMQSCDDRKRELTEEYNLKIHKTFKNISGKIRQTKDGLDRLVSLAVDDPRKARLADEVLQRAKAVMELYRAESGNVEQRFSAELNSAIQYYQAGDYDLSYSKASGVALNCLHYLEDTKKQQQVFFQLEDDVTRRLAVIEERMSEARKITFAFDGKLIEEDLFRFEPELFQGIQKQAVNLKNRLAVIQGFHRDHIAALRMLLADCNELDLDILSVSKYASAKMAFAYSENKDAETVSSVLEEQGFQMLEYEYDGGIEGNAMHINFEHTITGERLTVVLTPTSHGIQVSVHNFGSGDSIGNTQTQQAVQQALEYEIGRAGTCNGLGLLSQNTRVADLDAVKNASTSSLNEAKKYAQGI